MCVPLRIFRNLALRRHVKWHMPGSCAPTGGNVQDVQGSGGAQIFSYRELCIQEDFPVESAASRSGRIGDR